MKFLTFLCLLVTSLGCFAGGLFSDLSHTIKPPDPQSVTSSFLPNPNSIYNQFDAISPEPLQAYDFIKENSLPTGVFSTENLSPNNSEFNWEYSYVCMTSFGSCPSNSYATVGTPCFCSTLDGLQYGIVQ